MSTSDNEIIEAAGRIFRKAVWPDDDGLQMIAAELTAITKRAEEAVLRKLIDRVEGNAHGFNISTKFKPGVRLFIKKFARENGLTLEGDANG